LPVGGVFLGGVVVGAWAWGMEDSNVEVVVWGAEGYEEASRIGVGNEDVFGKESDGSFWVGGWEVVGDP
jgi:hypothetical protein